MGVTAFPRGSAGRIEVEGPRRFTRAWRPRASWIAVLVYEPRTCRLTDRHVAHRFAIAEMHAAQDAMPNPRAEGPSHVVAGRRIAFKPPHVGGCLRSSDAASGSFRGTGGVRGTKIRGQ